MAVIHPLTKDACVLSLGANRRFSFRRGALDLLLFPRDDTKTTRVPLQLGRDHEAGDITLSKTGRTLLVRVYDPSRLLVAKADDARAFLRDEVNAVLLTDATDNEVGRPRAPPPAPEDAAAAAQARRDALAELAARTRRRLAGEPEDGA